VKWLGPIAGLAAACSMARAVPDRAAAQAWTQGQRIVLEGTPSIGANMGGASPQMFSAIVESELREAGFTVLSAGDPQDLHLKLVSAERARASAAVARNGETIEPIEIDGDQLGCVSIWWGEGDVQRDNFKCYARGMLNAIVGSPRIAAAAGLARSERRAPVAARVPASGKLAVLELRNFTRELTKENAQYFTDVVRSAALKAQPQLEVVTRENLLVLLQASGKDLANCEGECEVDTGRRIGADQIVSGEIQKLGTLYKLSLRLHDTREGRLLASTQASGKTIEELDAAAQQAAAELLH
jgi:hypothetical protein